MEVFFIFVLSRRMETEEDEDVEVKLDLSIPLRQIGLTDSAIFAASVNLQSAMGRLYLHHPA